MLVEWVQANDDDLAIDGGSRESKRAEGDVQARAGRPTGEIWAARYGCPTVAEEAVKSRCSTHALTASCGPWTALCADASPQHPQSHVEDPKAVT